MNEQYDREVVEQMVQRAAQEGWSQGYIAGLDYATQTLAQLRQAQQLANTETDGAAH